MKLSREFFVIISIKFLSEIETYLAMATLDSNTLHSKLRRYLHSNTRLGSI